MSDSITNFFDAWQLDVAEMRLEKIRSAVLPSVEYADPRTPEMIQGIEALNEYVAMFSANAPGWAAKVLKSDEVSGSFRVTVAFSGIGPEGKELTQLGQYFVELEDSLIARMVGFVGTGEIG